MPDCVVRVYCSRPLLSGEKAPPQESATPGAVKLFRIAYRFVVVVSCFVVTEFFV